MGFAYRSLVESSMIAAYRGTLAEGETFTTFESKISRHSRVVPDHIAFPDIDSRKDVFWHCEEHNHA
jgi:hypothetical protein